ncbi:hypothetical protein FQN54_000409 [Arachnomyces sp. PD_36]|nr:hypothetical protein FQN54_000409 [Arachnomyces sp. PD_36]
MPLVRNGKTDVRRGTLEHNSIIGRNARDLIQAHKGPEYRVTIPSLDEYVSFTRRLVTPVYSADANLIVSLLDIHVSPPSTDQGPPAPLEILESGTGHGSLTLHLARAIHAANTLPPPFPSKTQRQILGEKATGNKPESAASEGQKDPEAVSPEDQVQQEWDSWRAQRGAVIHTVDIAPKFSAHAEKIVRGFRRGMYTGDVDFYVSSVEDWIAEQTRRRTRGLLSNKMDPFLSYAILDMPSAHKRIPNVAPIMKDDGVLAVFMPSVTQIGDCVDIIRQQRLPFILEKAVELGTGISSGRLWDVRFAVKKGASNDAVDGKRAVEGEEQNGEETASESEPDAGTSSEKSGEEESVLVCRPKVGARIVGGGFVGIFRRMKHSPS